MPVIFNKTIIVTAPYACSDESCQEASDQVKAEWDQAFMRLKEYLHDLDPEIHVVESI